MRTTLNLADDVLGTAKMLAARQRRPLGEVISGLIRVAGQPQYPNCLGTSGRVREILRQFSRQVHAEASGKEISLLVEEILLRPELF